MWSIRVQPLTACDSMAQFSRELLSKRLAGALPLRLYVGRRARCGTVDGRFDLADYGCHLLHLESNARAKIGGGADIGAQPCAAGGHDLTAYRKISTLDGERYRLAEL
jgi:hypothetical protein